MRGSGHRGKRDWGTRTPLGDLPLSDLLLGFLGFLLQYSPALRRTWGCQRRDFCPSGVLLLCVSSSKGLEKTMTSSRSGWGEQWTCVWVPEKEGGHFGCCGHDTEWLCKLELGLWGVPGHAAFAWSSVLIYIPPQNSWRSVPPQESTGQHTPGFPGDLVAKATCQYSTGFSPKVLSLHSVPPNCVPLGGSLLNSVLSQRDFYPHKRISVAPFLFLREGLHGDQR